MKLVRNLVALILAIAVANYGVVATASAHTHDDHGFHQVHVAIFDGSDHDHGHGVLVPERITPDLDKDAPTPASDHSETGFHSHSTPQFGPNDGTLLLAFGVILGRVLSPDPQDLMPLHRESPPFKPPRSIL